MASSDTEYVGIEIEKWHMKYSSVESAKMAVRMMEILRNRFMREANHVMGAVDMSVGDISLERFLNHMDTIATFSERGVIWEEDMLSMFGGLYAAIGEDSGCQRVLAKYPKLFSPLRGVILHIREEKDMREAYEEAKEK